MVSCPFRHSEHAAYPPTAEEEYSPLIDQQIFLRRVQAAWSADFFFPPPLLLVPVASTSFARIAWAATFAILFFPFRLAVPSLKSAESSLGS